MYSGEISRANADAPVDCTFCHGRFIVTSILYQDDDLVVINDLYPAGKTHWLIMPLRHIRSVEVLTPSDLPLYRKMLAVKEELLQKHFPDLTPAARETRLRTGFHRGGRNIPVFGSLILPVPDVISVKHLHLHVIVDLHGLKNYVKFPLWNEMVFIKADVVLRRLEEEEKRLTKAGETLTTVQGQHSEL